MPRRVLLALVLVLTGCATAHAWPPMRGSYGGTGSLSITINPSSQTVSRVGDGSLSTAVTYTVSGGKPPYTYATTAPGLAITGSTTTAPSFAATLTAGQDITYNLTGTVTDSSSHPKSAQAQANIEFVATATTPLSLVVTPGSQTVSRFGAGSISAGVTYTASGGVPPYGYSTTAPGLSISGGTSTTPSVSTTLTGGQDTTYTVTGTVTDSAGSTPASTPATVEFIASAPPPALAIAVAPTTQQITRSGAGAVSALLTYTATGGTPPYTYSTSAPGLSISGGTTTTPTVSTTLTAGQDSTFSVTGTVTDSAAASANSTPASVEFTSIVPPLSLVVTPSSQQVNRTGAGAVSAGIAYTASGGAPPYTYSTTGGGLSVSGGTTTTPTVSTTLSAGQDTTYTVTGTVNDSVGTTPAVTPASVRFTANAPLDPLVPLARGMVGDNIMQTQIQAPAGPAPTYTPIPKVDYSAADLANLRAAGITYIRIPVDVQQLLPGLPLPTSYLQQTSLGSGVWQPLSPNITKTVANPTGCTDATYFSTACTVAYDLAYLDSTVSAMIADHFAVDLVPFVAGTFPGACSAAGTCPSGAMHANFGTGALYGYSSFEAMIQAADLVLVNRYKTLYPGADQVFWELYNEPDYKASGGAAYQNPALWNAAIISITNAIRAVDTTHWIISDGISSAKAQFLTSLVPTADTQTVYSFHKYDPSEFVDQTSGSSWNPYAVYPRPSSGEPAIGRPGGIAPAYMPFPAPVVGVPANSTVDTTASCTARGLGTPVWAANSTTVLTVHGEKACVSANGGATAFVDFYTGNTSSLQVTKADLLTNSADGIQLALDWAAVGGHTGPLSGSVLKIIAGEIGLTGETDYLSRLQFITDLRDTLDNASVVGGQTSVPWDWWAFSGQKFGVRPKGGGPTTQGSNCLGLSGALTGYDLDEWARISTPIGSTTPNCSGGKYATPGY